MTKKIGLGILLAMTATAASAATTPSCTQPTSFIDQILSLFISNNSCSGGGSTGSAGGDVRHVNAPEIDPSSAVAGLTLMSAGLVVLRGRRKSK